MEPDNTRTAITLRTLTLTVCGIAIIMFLITGFSWEALIGVLFVGAVSIIVYRSIYNAEEAAQEEAIHVVDRHKNPQSYNSPHSTSNVEVMDDLDLELETLLSSAFTPEEVEKIERANSPYDASFELTWKNFFHYLIKGKQIGK